MENELNLVTLAQYFSDEDKAREFLESVRWPDGPVCPHCGEVNNAYRLEPKPSKKDKHVRKGVWKCGGCREQFTVTVGTIFEDSHIPLSKWLLAYHLLCASKKGMSAHQLHRMLKVTYRSAWFMAHRIRYTMTQEPLSSKLQGIVEVDETYVGGKLRVGTYKPKDNYHRKRLAPVANKATVVSVLQRGGRVQSRHVEQVTSKNLREMVNTMVDESAHVMTDSSTVLKKAFLGERTHSQVNHYTSILSVQEASVLTFRRGAPARDNFARTDKIARIVNMNKEIALSAAKLEAFIADDAKEEEVNRLSKQRRKWDCFHVATAQFYGCAEFYAIDSKMLNRGNQLSIKNMEFSKPEPRSTPLFKGLNAGGLALHD